VYNGVSKARELDEDSSEFVFFWKALKMTPTSLELEIQYENPLLVSLDQKVKDKIQMTVLDRSFFETLDSSFIDPDFSLDV